MDAEKDFSSLDVSAVSFYSAEEFVAFINDNFPLFGTVQCVGDRGNDSRYFFLELPRFWHDAEAFLIEKAKLLLQYDKRIEKVSHEFVRAVREKNGVPIPRVEELSFFSCPHGGMGLHVSVGSNRLGERVAFRVTQLMRFANQRLGKSSEFDEKAYVADRIALKVDLIENDAAKAGKVELVSSPHISIACYGFYGKIVYEDDTKKGKGKGKGNDNNNNKSKKK